MSRMILIVAIALVALSTLPMAAHAAPIVVTSGSDVMAGDTDTGNPTCAAASGFCTLRAAVEQMEAETEPEPYVIHIDPSVTSIDLQTMLTITKAIEIDGCNGDDEAPAPCADITYTSAGYALRLNGYGTTVNGIAFSSGDNTTTAIGALGSHLTVTNSWFGMRSDGTAGTLGTGIEVRGDHVTVGGTSAFVRNVFTSSTTAVSIMGGTDVTISGNYFGTNAQGTAGMQNGHAVGLVGTAIKATPNGGSVAQDIVIGGELSAPALATPQCDGACNVINADVTGILLDTTALLDVRSVDIFGNYMGLEVDGVTPLTLTAGDAVLIEDALLVQVGDGTAATRNVIAGDWDRGVRHTTANGGTIVDGNYIGVDRTGAVRQSIDGAGIYVTGGPSNPDHVIGNRVAVGVGGVGIAVTGTGANVLSNVIGLGVGGESFPMAGGIVVTGDENTIGDLAPQRNIVCSSTTEHAISVKGGDGNFIGANQLGVDETDAACTGGRANYGGVLVATDGTTAEGNHVGGIAGGPTASNSLHDGVNISTMGTGNEITFLSGSGNLEQMIDVGGGASGDGAGNTTTANGDVATPVISSASNRSVAGAGAPVGATIRVYEVSAADGAVPTDIIRLVATEIDADGGNWLRTLDGFGVTPGMRLAVTFTDSSTSTSELSVAEVTLDKSPPVTRITSGPSGTVASSTQVFAFDASGDAGATFACRVDGAAFASCTSPFSTGALADGAHTFQVRAIGSNSIVHVAGVTQSFTIDATAPDVTIGTKPAAKLRATSATFAFSSADAGATFRCSLDNAASAACASPLNLTKLKQGTHTFAVTAVDTVGNASAAAVATFEVDSIAPTLKVVSRIWTTNMKGVARPTLSCVDKHTPCSVKVTIKSAKKVSVNGAAAKFVTFGSPTVSVKGGKATATAIKLSTSGLAKLRALGSTRAQVTFVMKDGFGNVRTTKLFVTLR